MKKIAAIILTLALALLLFGCTSDKGRSGSEEGRKGEINYLVLVNRTHQLPEGWEDSLETVHMTNSQGLDVEVEKVSYEHYLLLKEALEKEGVYIDLDNARRSVAEQQEIWDEFMEEYGEEYTRTYVAVPGYSEHQTGLALDLYLVVDGVVIVLNEDLVQYPEIWAKIHEKLPEYGFILRYPQGREKDTGYGYEEWHIRYVGEEAAKIIAEKDLILEDYLLRLSAS